LLLRFAGVTINTYKVIYNLIDDVKAAMEGKLRTIEERQPLGSATVSNSCSCCSLVLFSCFDFVLCVVLPEKVVQCIHLFVVPYLVRCGHGGQAAHDRGAAATGQRNGEKFKQDANEMLFVCDSGCSCGCFHDDCARLIAAMEGKLRKIKERQPLGSATVSIICSCYDTTS
jgi:hypothetical protein